MQTNFDTVINILNAVIKTTACSDVLLTTVINNNGVLAQELLELLKGAVEEILRDDDYPHLTKIKTHTTVAGNDQGDIHALIPDLSRILPDSVFLSGNNTLSAVKKINSAELSYLIANSTTASSPLYAIIGNNLYFFGNDITTAGKSVNITYISNNKFRANNGVEKEYITADSDTVLIDRNIIIAYICYKFMRNRGGDYDGHYADYRVQLSKIKDQDKISGFIPLCGGNNYYDQAFWAQHYIFKHF